MERLSIIFQGPATRDGFVCPQVVSNVRRTRQVFPRSEIIVSTWYTVPETDRRLVDEMALLDVRVVLSHDPGSIVACDASGHWVSNLNRLLVSAQTGLKCATRPLSLKMRTDTFLSGRDIEPLLRKYVLDDAGPARDENYCIFRKRVINASWFARDPRGSLPYLFHPGDIFIAGLTSDVQLFFSAPLADSSLLSPAAMPGLWSAWRYTPEQWLWIHAIQQVTGRNEYQGNFTFTADRIEASERYYLANFVPFSPRQLRFHWPKYWRCYPLRGLFSVYTHARWQRLTGEKKAESTACFMSRQVLTWIWRRGYILRACALRHPLIRRIARSLFVYR